MYKVSWEEEATKEMLAQTAAADPAHQQSVIEASLEVERLLSDKPDQIGESRELGSRVLIVQPLTIVYHINHFEQEVFVTSIRVHNDRS